MTNFETISWEREQRTLFMPVQSTGHAGNLCKGLSVEVGVKIVTDAIPNTIGITFSAMVVLAIMKATLVGHGFL
jgi:hypothetical protein